MHSAPPARVFRAAPALASRWTWVIGGLMAATALLMVMVVARTSYGAATLAYTVADDTLAIRFGFHTERIPLSAITAVHQLQPTRGRRVRGTGLPQLREGWFSFAETGRIKLYATSVRPLVVLEAGDRKWGVSPADRAAFMHAVQQGASGTFLPPPGAYTFANLGLLIVVGGLVGVLVPGGMLALMVYFRRVPASTAYTLHSDELEIRMGWTRMRIPYRRITDVRVASPEGRPWRYFGTGMPGLYWGHFGWRNVGPNLHLYATQLRPLVIVRTGIATYGISPMDADGFVRELTGQIERG